MTKSYDEDEIEALTIQELNEQGPPEDFEWGIHLHEADHTRFYYAVDDVKARFTHWQCEDCGDDAWTEKPEMPDTFHSVWSDGVEILFCDWCYEQHKEDEAARKKNERLKRLIQDGVKWDD